MYNMSFDITYPSEERVLQLMREFATQCKGDLKANTRRRYFVCIHCGYNKFSNKMMLNRHRFLNGCCGTKYPDGKPAPLLSYPDFLPGQGKMVEGMRRVGDCKDNGGQEQLSNLTPQGVQKLYTTPIDLICGLAPPKHEKHSAKRCQRTKIVSVSPKKEKSCAMDEAPSLRIATPTTTVSSGPEDNFDVTSAHVGPTTVSCKEYSHCTGHHEKATLVTQTLIESRGDATTSEIRVETQQIQLSPELLENERQDTVGEASSPEVVLPLWRLKRLKRKIAAQAHAEHNRWELRKRVVSSPSQGENRKHMMKLELELMLDRLWQLNKQDLKEERESSTTNEDDHLSRSEACLLQYLQQWSILLHGDTQIGFSLGEIGKEGRNFVEIQSNIPEVGDGQQVVFTEDGCGKKEGSEAIANVYTTEDHEFVDLVVPHSWHNTFQKFKYGMTTSMKTKNCCSIGLAEWAIQNHLRTIRGKRNPSCADVNFCLRWKKIMWQHSRTFLMVPRRIYLHQFVPKNQPCPVYTTSISLKNP